MKPPVPDSETKGYGSELKRIGTSSLILVTMTLLGQISGLAREATVAYFLGATGRADAYIAAFQPIDILTTALIMAVPFGLIPFIVSYQRRFGDAGSQWAVDRVQLGTVFCFLIISLLLYRRSDWIVHLTYPHLSGAELGQAIQLWHWMLPAIPVASLTAFFIAQLIAEDRFFFAGANSMLLNVSIICAPLIAWRLIGVRAFALGVLLGFLLQLITQGSAVLTRNRRKSSQIKMSLLSLCRDAAAMIVPVVLLYILGGGSVLIPRRFASSMGEGDLAIFTYATRATLPIYLLGMFAISYPYFSTFARATASGEIDQARRLLRSMLRSVVLFALPAMSAIVVLRKPIVRILFFRGAFDAQAAESVAATLAFLAPFILGALVTDLLGRCLIALGRTLIACCLYAGLLALSWSLISGLQGFGGLKGVSAAWAISFYVVAAFFLVAVNHNLQGRAFQGISYSLGRALLSGAAAAVVMAFSNYCLNFWFNAGMLFSLLNILLTISAGGLVLVGFARWLRVSEAIALVDVVQASKNKLRNWLVGASSLPSLASDQD